MSCVLSPSVDDGEKKERKKTDNPMEGWEDGDGEWFRHMGRKFSFFAKYFFMGNNFSAIWRRLARRAYPAKRVDNGWVVGLEP